MVAINAFRRLCFSTTRASEAPRARAASMYSVPKMSIRLARSDRISIEARKSPIVTAGSVRLWTCPTNPGRSRKPETSRARD